MILMLILLFLLRGANVVCVQLAQRGRVSTIPQSVVFVTIYSALQAIVFLLIPPYSLSIPDLKFLIYPFFFAMLYSVGNVLLLKTLRLGSAAVANTIGQFNMLVPVAFGMIYWGESLGVFQIIGLVLFIIGLLIYNGSSVSVGEEKQKISVKFLIYAVVSMLFTGSAVIFTKLGMAAYPEFGKQYLFYYAFFAMIIGAIISLKTAPGEIKPLVRDKKLLLNCALAAISVDITNVIFVSYINAFPTAIFMPSYSVIGMLGIMLASRVVLKEKISKSAMISSLVCIIAILCLNL